MCRYCFSLYSNELKHHFGYTQEEIQGIGSANNLGTLTPASCLNPQAAERLSQFFYHPHASFCSFSDNQAGFDLSGLPFNSQDINCFGQLWRRGLSEHSKRPAV